MKVRKELALARKDMLKEISNIMDDHNCDGFYEEGMTCVLCCLLSIQKPLALLQYLRGKGKLMKLLETESRLYDLLGDKVLKQKIKEEMEIIRNTPKKRCFNCGRIVTVWMSYSDAALYVNSVKEGKLKVDCASCGEKNYFSKEELKFKKHKKNTDNLVRALGLANRFGYNTETEYDQEPPSIDYESHEEEEEDQ